MIDRESCFGPLDLVLPVAGLHRLAAPLTSLGFGRLGI